MLRKSAKAVGKRGQQAPFATGERGMARPTDVPASTSSSRSPAARAVIRMMSRLVSGGPSCTSCQMPVSPSITRSRDASTKSTAWVRLHRSSDVTVRRPCCSVSSARNIKLRWSDGKHDFTDRSCFPDGLKSTRECRTLPIQLEVLSPGCAMFTQHNCEFDEAARRELNSALACLMKEVTSERRGRLITAPPWTRPWHITGSCG